MISLTDIPHYLVAEHCKSYGKFGIVFKKLALIDYGANPVLYLTNIKRNDAEEVYNFICKANTVRITLDPGILESLKKLFGFVQDYDHGSNICYYEREWRILENNLKYCEEETIQPGQCGSFNRDGEVRYYFQFSQNDVEFLICPKDYANQLAEVTNKYPILIYEYLVL